MSAEPAVLGFKTEELIQRHDPRGRLANYLMFLGAENQKVNLVSRETGRRGMMRLIAESLLPLEIIDGSAVSSYLDIGSGGGLPAIPLVLSGRLAVVPDRRPVLCERRQKKAAALRRICINLGLRVDIVAESIEQASITETFDLITLRAVKLTPQFMVAVEPLLSEEGVLIYWDRVDFELGHDSIQSRQLAYQLDNQDPERIITTFSRK